MQECRVSKFLVIPMMNVREKYCVWVYNDDRTYTFKIRCHILLCISHPNRSFLFMPVINLYPIWWIRIDLIRILANLNPSAFVVKHTYHDPEYSYYQLTYRLVKRLFHSFALICTWSTPPLSLCLKLALWSLSVYLETCHVPSSWGIGLVF